MHQTSPDISNPATLPTADAQRAMNVATATGAAGLGAAILLAFFHQDGFRHLFYAYLASYAFYLSISLGALSFVALQHATRAGWSATVRRLNE
ncbi:MAG: quinol:cytochrome C oxidoreductase, partial [Thermoguttaceae bacterium]